MLYTITHNTKRLKTMPTKAELWKDISAFDDVQVKKTAKKADLEEELKRLKKKSSGGTPRAVTTPHITDDQYLRLIEKADLNALNHIITHKEIFRKHMRPSCFNEQYDPFKLSELYLARSKKEAVEVVYKQTNSFGRFNAQGSIGLQSMPREIRHTIAQEQYVDIDVVNAHPIILSFLCRLHEFECPTLDAYNSNREKHLNDLGDRDTAKKTYLSLTNGGSSHYHNTKNKPSFLTDYKNELISIHKQFSTHPDHVSHAERRRDIRVAIGKDYNHEASYVNTLLCDMENKILMTIYEYFGSPVEAVLCFDGLMLKKGEYDLDACSKYVLEKMGVKIELKVKGMTEGFDLSNEDIRPYKPLDIQEVKEDGIYGRGDNTPEMSLICSDHTDEDYAEFFVKKYDSFISVCDVIYYYANGSHTWASGDDSLIYEFLGTTVYKDLRMILDRSFNSIAHADLHAKYSKSLLKLRSRSQRKGIVLSILPKITRKNDIFDQKPFIIGFDNGVYDLEQGVFRTGLKTDFVSKSTGYNYDDPNEERIEFLNGFINKIMPIEDERNVLLKAMGSGLYGQAVQRFFILTGVGSNGKDALTTKLFKSMLGRDYFEYSNTTILTEKRKGALSQEIANLNKKRTVVWNEPPRQSILQGGPIKELTGSSEINARGLYSKTTNVQLMETCFMLCNDIPRIDNVDGGVARRVIVVPFRSLFKTPDEIEKMSNKQYVFEVDKYYDSVEFHKDYRMSLFHILVKYFNMWKVDKFLFKNLPKSIVDLSSGYLQDSDDFISWFNEVFETSETDFIQLKDVFTMFKDSDLYENMSKREKRLMTRKNMEEQVKKHPTLRGHYKETYKPLLNGKRKLFRSILTGFKVREDEVSDNEDDFDDLLTNLTN